MMGGREDRGQGWPPTIVSSPLGCPQCGFADVAEKKTHANEDESGAENYSHIIPKQFLESQLC